MSDWMTYREAARLLGVHVSLIPKMVRRGDLTSRHERPALLRDQVLVLKAARATAASERALRRAKPRVMGPQPPDDRHPWILAPAAAIVLGCSEAALQMRTTRGRVPFVLHRGRRWYRLDLLELQVRAQAAREHGVVFR